VNISSHLRVSIMNLNFAVNSIKPFVKGEWVRPQPLNDWESFWKV
jgi:hypothetical protein